MNIQKIVGKGRHVDYKSFIGKKVSVKVLGIRSTVEGVLSAVYSDVIVVQGLTCWGILDKNILDFKIEHEQFDLRLS